MKAFLHVIVICTVVSCSSTIVVDNVAYRVGGATHAKLGAFGKLRTEGKNSFEYYWMPDYPDTIEGVFLSTVTREITKEFLADTGYSLDELGKASGKGELKLNEELTFDVFTVPDRWALIEGLKGEKDGKTLRFARRNKNYRIITTVLKVREYNKTKSGKIAIAGTAKSGSGSREVSASAKTSSANSFSKDTILAYAYARFAWNPHTRELEDLQDDSTAFDSGLDPGLVKHLPLEPSDPIKPVVD